MQELRFVLASILMLGLAIPGVALADDDNDNDGKRCSIIGSWFGIVDRDNPTLTGVAWTTMGKSENRGTNLLDQVNTPDPTLGGLIPGAVRTSPLRGNWLRTGKRTFVYTLTGYGVDAANNMVGIVKFRGDVDMTRDCQFGYVTAKVDIYYPPNSPFADNPDVPDLQFPGQWGRKTHVELP